MTFPRLAWGGLAVLALHNAEEALTMPDWFARHGAQLAAEFHVRPLAAEPARLYIGLILVTVLPAIWVALASRAAPRSAGSYSILVLYGVFLANAFVPHLLGAALLRGYVPGVLTAGVLVVPFTAWLARRSWLDGYATKRGAVVSLLMGAVLYLPGLVALLGLGKKGAW